MVHWADIFKFSSTFATIKGMLSTLDTDFLKTFTPN